MLLAGVAREGAGESCAGLVRCDLAVLRWLGASLPETARLSFGFWRFFFALGVCAERMFESDWTSACNCCCCCGWFFA